MPQEPRNQALLRASVIPTVVASLGIGCATSTEPPEQPQASPTPSASPTRPKPNFVFILTDDFDALSAPFMPKSQSLLVQRGVSFSNAFCADPLSAPARATLLTGLHAHNHGVNNNINSFTVFRSAGLEQRSLARWLKTAGYSTALIGKSLNHYIGEEPWAYWDEWQSFYPTSGETCSSCVYYNYSIREKTTTVRYGSDELDYLTDVLANRAVTYLKQAASHDAPFFLWFAPSAPHMPAEYPSRHRHTYAGEKAPRTPSFNEDDMSDKPLWQRTNLPRLDDDDIRDVDSYHRARLRALLAVDDAVERIVQTLTDTGKLDNTFIILTSDNGYLLAQHRVSNGKGLPYENCVRVPLIVRGPEVPEGATRDHLVSNVDIAPTLADLAQATAPDDVDGRVSTALLRSNPPAPSAWRPEVLLEGFSTGEDSLPEFHGLRTATDSYVEYYSAEIELYSLTSDPDQLQSLHQSASAATLTQWASRLSGLRACRAAACR
jgi:N-acetylglucosamine-6-sulfatase